MGYMDKVQTCPHCGKEFPTTYPSNSVIDDWRHNAQLAEANYNRHVSSCDKDKTTQKRN